MNKMNLYHCDLKTKNVIFKKDEFMLKIIDFGMCVKKIPNEKMRLKGYTESYLPFNLRIS